MKQYPEYESIKPRTWLPNFIYLAVLITVGLFAARQALSDYYIRSASLTDSLSAAAAAKGWQPENPAAYEVSGEIHFKNKDFEAASQTFRDSISLRPSDYRLWLRFGEANERSGQIETAKAAYESALALAPNYKYPNHQMGMILLNAGRSEEAFFYLKGAAEHDTEYYGQLLRLAGATYHNDPAAIQQVLKPTSQEGKQALARHFIESGLMTDNVRLYLSGSDLEADSKDEFIRLLLHKHNFNLAREVWLSKPDNQGNTDTSLIFDGGFERIPTSDHSGLGWVVGQDVTSISAARDSTEAHSGTCSLYIKFAGDVEAGRAIISQLAYLGAERKYQLTWQVRSTEMVSAGLPQIVVIDEISGQTLGRSAEIKATNGSWVGYKLEFTSKETPIVRVGLIRSGCESTPCPIFGDLSLDDFVLTPK